MSAICSLIKYRNEETGDILIGGPGAYFTAIGGNVPMTALAFLCLGDLEMYDGDNKTTVREKYEELKQYTIFTEITKEEFYSLE